ncbi:MAG: ATPase, T2SS/T4P/T4SS family, partial [Candidatus Magasanikiibacteriota bacterium]
MSNLPSIDDLLSSGQSKSNQDDDSSHPVLNISSSEVEEKFSKKMNQVGLKQKEEEAQKLGQSLGYPHIDLAKFPVSHEALRQVPKELAEELGVVCFFATTDEVRLGALDPSMPEVQELLHEVEEDNHSNGAIYVISENSLDSVLKLYANLPDVKPISKDVEIKAEDLEAVQSSVNDFASLQEALDRKSASDLLILLLGAALKLEASDLHIEAEADNIAARLRLDGMLHDAANLPKEDYKRLINRIKLVSGLKINVVDKPQDGRFTINLPEGDVDVRVSTMPTVYGESVVM